MFHEVRSGPYDILSSIGVLPDEGIPSAECAGISMSKPSHMNDRFGSAD
jgi:hypothetical protein